MSHFHIHGPYLHVHDCYSCVFFFFILVHQILITDIGISTWWKFVCDIIFLAINKNLTLIILNTENERLTFHFCCCGKIALSCSNSYWYFMFHLEGEQILLSKIFFWMYFFCLQHEKTGIMHAMHCTHEMLAISVYFMGVFLEEC